jgi:hypothetical protein
MALRAPGPQELQYKIFKESFERDIIERFLDAPKPKDYRTFFSGLCKIIEQRRREYGKKLDGGRLLGQFNVVLILWIQHVINGESGRHDLVKDRPGDLELAARKLYATMWRRAEDCTDEAFARFDFRGANCVIAPIPPHRRSRTCDNIAEWDVVPPRGGAGAGDGGGGGGYPEDIMARFAMLSEGIETAAFASMLPDAPKGAVVVQPAAATGSARRVAIALPRS